MKNKKSNKTTLLILLLLGISIGYAALSTTLKINGTTTIAKNTWDIYWDHIDNQSGVTPTTVPVIGDDNENGVNTVVTWGVTLDKPGDYFEFTVDAVNAGSIDAEILKIEHKLNGAVMDNENKLPPYIKYTVAYADGVKIKTGRLLPKAPDLTSTPKVLTREPIKVRVAYDRDVVTNSDVNSQAAPVTYNLSFEITYGQATAGAKPARVIANFATDSFESIADCYGDGDPSGTLKTAMDNGTTRAIGLDMDQDGEVDTTANIRIANMSRPAVCDSAGFSQSSCGLVIEFADVIATHRMNPYDQGANVDGDGNKGGWYYSEMRDYVNDDIYNALPEDLRNAIIPTEVVSGYGSKDSENLTSTDNLYLLSLHEVLEDTDGNPNDGPSYYDKAYNQTRQLDVYKANTNASRIKQNLNEINSVWSLRTASIYRWHMFFLVSSNGGTDSDLVTTEYGVSPAFRLASE